MTVSVLSQGSSTSTGLSSMNISPVGNGTGIAVIFVATGDGTTVASITSTIPTLTWTKRFSHLFSGSGTGGTQNTEVEIWWVSGAINAAATTTTIAFTGGASPDSAAAVMVIIGGVNNTSAPWDNNPGLTAINSTVTTGLTPTVSMGNNFFDDVLFWAASDGNSTGGFNQGTGTPTGFTIQENVAILGNTTAVSLLVGTKIVSSVHGTTAYPFSTTDSGFWAVVGDALGNSKPFVYTRLAETKTISYLYDPIPSNSSILSGGAVVVNPNVMQWTATWDRTFVNYINDWQPPNNVELLSPVQLMGQPWFCL